MPQVLLTKRIEFAAAHRYHNPAWDAARNRAVFGACNNDPGHGHNYMIEVTVAGEVDPQTGMVVNLYDLKRILKEVLEEFDHKHLNLDTPYFRQTIPTTENIARVLWGILEKQPSIGRLEKVRLFEDEDLSADITAEGQRASLTRRYHFSAAHRLSSERLSETDRRRLFGKCGHPEGHGHNYVLAVTVGGAIDPDTGMVTDIQALDRVVRERVVQRFDHRNLNQDPDLARSVPTGETLARLIWDSLVKAIPAGRLERVGLGETRETSYEYAG
ncbi:MAG: 6-carboxytetrahydropterin synthase [Nitrospirae bacterium]|nr:6-carboxytetrahydropterin synthase [Nitrospirota bacterium]